MRDLSDEIRESIDYDWTWGELEQWAIAEIEYREERLGQTVEQFFIVADLAEQSMDRLAESRDEAQRLRDALVKSWENTHPEDVPTFVLEALNPVTLREGDVDTNTGD